MQKLRIHLLGGLRIYSGKGRPIAIPARKGQALLAYLARHPGRPQPRGKLAALLWEESGEIQARASMRQALTVVRKATGLGEGELISGSGDTISLNADCMSVDVQAFEGLLEEDRPEALSEAIAHYDGEFLEGFNAKAPAFEDWLMTERQRLRERAIDAMSRLLAHDMASGLTEPAIEMALRLLALDPLQESVHRSLMQLYARQGRATSALRQFRICRAVLQRELRTTPEPETERLYKHIRQQRQGRPDAADEHDRGEDTEVSLQPDGDSPAEDVEDTSQLRQVTVVCVEMAEPAHVPEEVDPERFQQLCDRFVETVRKLVERYGGTIEQQMGGVVVAVFGMPPAHTDDAERAVRAALDVQEAMRSWRDDVEQYAGTCIGIAGGQAVVTHRPDTAGRSFRVQGAVTRLAAKLAAAALPGEVLLSEMTYETLKYLAASASRRTVTYRGSSKPLLAWQVYRMRTRPTPAARTSFVGRRAELRQFRGLIDACRESGRGLTIYLRGDAGIGKSRLVEEFQTIATGLGFTCHTGQLFDFGGGGGQDAIRVLVRGLLGLPPEREAADRSAVESAVAGNFIADAQQMYLYDLLRLQQPRALRALYDSMENTARDTGICETLQAIVRHAGKQQPRMIVIEDVHWADPLTLARSAALAAAAQICPTLLILTARTEGDPLNAAWRGKAGGSGLMTMDLGPLRREEAIALAAEFASADDPVAIRCIERSGGNPLFLEQLLRSGNRVGDGVPGSVQSVVLARMDMLAADNRHALQIASILGQRVSAVALRFLIGHSRANWNGLVQDGLLRPDGEDFHFAHALIQEGAYASLPKSRRRNLHRRAADWFAGRDATLHAEHLDRAEDPAAARAYLDAARGQAREYRYEQALHMAERGAELATEPEAFSLHCFVADMLLELGSVDEALAAFEQAREVARENRELCRAWLGRAACLRILDRYSDALEALDRAEAAIGTDRLPEERARICSMRGNLYFPLGRIKDCRNQHQRALEFAKRAASMEAEARAIGGLGDAYYQEGRMLTAFAHFNRCIELSRAHAFSRIEGTNLHVRALTRLYQNDVAGASEDAFAAVDWATKAGDLRARMAAHGAASIVLHDAGEPEEEKQHAGQCLGLAQRLGSPRFEQSARCNQAAALHALGDQAKAEAVLDRAYAICRVSDPGFAGPWILGFLALVTKKPDKRQWALAEGEDLLTNRECVGHNHLQFYRAAMETSLQGAMWREAERYAAALKEYTWSEPLPWSDYFIERARTLAALGRGVRPQALRARLDGLLREGKRADLRIALPALQSAMTVLTSRSHAPPTPQRGG